MVKIREKVFLPSEREVNKYLIDKFPAFAPGLVQGENLDVYTGEKVDYAQNGISVLRTPNYKTRSIAYLDVNGSVTYFPPDYAYAGYRYELFITYNPMNDVAKSLRIEERSAYIFNRNKLCKELVESAAPIVTFGKKNYIWLNKERCESGQDLIMRLYKENITQKAEPFTNSGNIYYGKAFSFRKAMEKDALKDCTYIELAMLVTAKIIEDSDHYNKLLPDETEAQIKYVYQKFAYNQVTENEFLEMFDQVYATLTERLQKDVAACNRFNEMVAEQEDMLAMIKLKEK